MNGSARKLIERLTSHHMIRRLGTRNSERPIQLQLEVDEAMNIIQYNPRVTWTSGKDICFSQTMAESPHKPTYKRKQTFCQFQYLQLKI